jgi:hypothetical protein
MKIETKYSIGQEVWFMKHLVPTRDRVFEIRITKPTRKAASKIKIRYGLKKSPFVANKVLEEDLFATKEELLASL